MSGCTLVGEEVEDISSSCDVGGDRYRSQVPAKGEANSTLVDVGGTMMSGKGQLEEHEFLGFMRRVKEREAWLSARHGSTH